MSVKLEWEKIDGTHERAKVIGGWVVKSYQDVLISMHAEQPLTEGYEWRESMVFIPDIGHQWK